MAVKEDLAARLAVKMAEVFSDELYGEEGCPLDADIDESKTMQCWLQKQPSMLSSLAL